MIYDLVIYTMACLYMMNMLSYDTCIWIGGFLFKDLYTWICIDILFKNLKTTPHITIT